MTDLHLSPEALAVWEYIIGSALIVLIKIVCFILGYLTIRLGYQLISSGVKGEFKFSASFGGSKADLASVSPGLLFVLLGVVLIGYAMSVGKAVNQTVEVGQAKMLSGGLPRKGKAESLDFSFSGLKTAVLYRVRGVPRRGENVKAEPTPALSHQEIADIAAGFQAACIDVIMEKLRRAAAQVGARSIIIGGGVSANRGLRVAMERFGLPVFFPPMRYCTDNAAMSAGLAQVYFSEGRFSDLALDAITYSQFRPN